MKLNHTIFSSATVAGITLLAGNVFAQEATVGVEAKAKATPTEATTTAEGEATAEAVEEEAVEEEAAEEEAAEEEAAEEEAPVEEVVAVEEETEVEEEVEVEEEESGGTPSLFVFADAWAGWQTAKSGSGSGGGVYANNGPADPVTGGSAESGFGINWLGVDLGYDGGNWAVNGSLRFGDAVAIYGTGTLGPITNAYVTYRPVEGLSLDLGAFGTIYGAEVAESWQNLNYTRGELYFNMQPFWHTGLRAEYATGGFVARALVVNDANSSNLGTGAINGGLQFGYDTGNFGIIAGALQSFKPDTTIANGGFIDTFFDVVATVSAGDFSLIGNADYNVGYATGGASFWGVSLAAGYAFTPAFGLALRGEYLSSKDGFLYGVAADGDEDMTTLTLTIDTKPVPGVENFVVRWDNRLEFASEDVYTNSDNSDVTGTWFASTIGVVGYADLL